WAGPPPWPMLRRSRPRRWPHTGRARRTRAAERPATAARGHCCRLPSKSCGALAPQPTGHAPAVPRAGRAPTPGHHSLLRLVVGERHLHKPLVVRGAAAVLVGHGGELRPVGRVHEFVLL